MTLLNTRTLVPQGQLLRQYDYLESGDFPTTTGLHLWHVNDVVYTGNPAIGSDVLTATGTKSSATNHLGETAENKVTIFWQLPNTNYDTANEAFTVTQWVRHGVQTAGTRYLWAKGNGGASSMSAALYFNANQSLTFIVYYTSSLFVQIVTPPLMFNDDGLFHHYASVYDPVTTSMLLVIDGKIMGYKVDTNLSARYQPTNSHVCFCGSGTNVVGPSTNFGGSLTDAIVSELSYAKYVMSFDQIRRLYVSGTKKLSYIDERNNVIILGEENSGRFGEYNINPTITGSTTFTTTRAAIVAYKTTDGGWRLRFNIAGTTSGAVNSLTLTLAGIVFKNSTFQAITVTPNSPAVTGSAYVTANTSTMTGQLQAAATQTPWYFSGDVELESKPTIVY